MSIKVLHVAHSRENSGVGDAIRHYQKAMIAAGLDVVSRPVLLNNSGFQLEDDLLALEKKSAKNCDVVIQHLLPRYMSYNGNYRKNIGYFVAETECLQNSVWINNLQLMDEVWVPNTSMLDENLNENIQLIPHACNPDDYLDTETLPQLEKTFNFYFVGEFSRRKNLAALLKAFHLEFRNEPVNLVLKINKPGYSGQVLFDEFKKFSDKIKEGLRLKPQNCISEIVITDFLTRQDLIRLHNTCDCFCNTSYGEAWSYPTFDAAAVGNVVISSNVGGPKDFLKNYDNSILVSVRHEHVFGVEENVVPELYNSSELWSSIDTYRLQLAMRDVYNQRKPKRRDLGQQLINLYSYNTIGDLIKKTL